MVSLIVCVVFGLFLACVTAAFLARHHARAEDLQAIIRAQRKCLDRLEEELSCAGRKAGEPAWGRPSRGLPVGLAHAVRGTSHSLNGRAGYYIEPSAN
jgi:hypothetical protein